MNDPLVAILAGILGPLGLLAIAWLASLSRLSVVTQPNQVAFISGSKQQVGGRLLGYRFVRGGRGTRLPLLETMDLLDIGTLAVQVNLAHAASRGFIPMSVESVAMVKIAGEMPRLGNAAERFLGRSREEVGAIAQGLLEGTLHGVLASLSPEKAVEDPLRLSHQVMEEAEADFDRMGLVLDGFKIQQIEDEVGYVELLGHAVAAPQPAPAEPTPPAPPEEPAAEPEPAAPPWAGAKPPWEK